MSKMISVLLVLTASACDLGSHPTGIVQPPLYRRNEPAGMNVDALDVKLIPDATRMLDGVPDAGGIDSVPMAPDVRMIDTPPIIPSPDAEKLIDTSTSDTVPEIIPPGTTVIRNNKTVGSMTGQSWISLGTQDSVTDPTCGNYPVTSSTTCTALSWNSQRSFCMSGSVPPVVNADYSDNWGILLGVNSTSTPGNPISTKWSTIAVNFTLIALNYNSLPTSGIYIVIHKASDPVGTTYQHDAFPVGTAWPITSFKTRFYGGGGTPFSATDANLIDWVGLQVSAVPGQQFDVMNLCLNNIVFGN